jgi:VanZ family protein
LTTHLSLWLPPLVYLAAIFYFSSQSNPFPEVREHVWDKLLHLLEYGGLAGLLCRALLGEGQSSVTAIAAAVFLAAAYGATDEYHQSLVPLRNADLQDWFVDVIGAVLGAVIWRRASRP